nr:JmjC domain-containing protein [Tanacetum cinerariifolium]
MYPRFLQLILDTDTEDTTLYPAPLVTKKFVANMRHYQGPDMPLLAYMLHLGEPALEPAQQQDVYQPQPSPVVAPHPSPDPMPSPPRQSSPPPIPFGPAPSSGVVSTEPIPDIPSSSGPSKPVLETITSPIRDDDTGGGSFHESPPSPPLVTPLCSLTVRVAEEPLTLTFLLALFPTCLQRIATLKAELKATRIIHRDTVVLFAKRIKKLESKLKSKKRKLVLSDSENEEEARQSQELDALLDLANAALHEPSDSTTPSKPANQEQSSEQEISPTTLDAVLTLSQSKARARAATILYKRLKKQHSSSGLDFTDAAIPAGGLDSAGGVDSAGGLVSAGGADSAGGVDSAGGLVSAGGVDSAGGLTSAGISVAAGPTVPAKPSSPIRDPSKSKAVATPSSPVSAPTAKEVADQQAAILEAERQELLEQELKQSIDAEQVYLDSLLAQREAEEQERKSMASAAQSAQRQAELDRVALNLTNEEWIGLVDQVRANPTLSAELLGADVSEDTFSVRMVELINGRRKMIAEMKAKAKREKPMTPAQQKEFMRTFVKNQSSTIYTTGWTWKDVRGLTDDQLQIVYDKIRRAVDLATAKDHHQQLKRSGETLESSELKKIKSSHSTTQPAELQETTSVSVGSTIVAGDPIPAVTSVSAVSSIPAVTSVSDASSIPAATPIPAGVSTTAGTSGSAIEASVPIIELLDSLPKDYSLQLDPKSEEHDVILRKSLRRKSIARKRNLPSPSKPKSDALLFNKEDPEAEFKRYLRQASEDDEPVEPVSLALNVYNKIRRAVDLATAKDHHQHLKRPGETLESLESKKLKSSHNTEQSAELLETTYVSAGATLAAGDPISAVPSVSAVSSIFAVPFISATSSILAETPIAAGVSTTTGVSESAFVPIIDLLDSPPKATSLPLDLAIAKQAVPLRKPSRKKSMARRRTLPRPSQSESAALPFDEDDPEAKFKKSEELLILLQLKTIINLESKKLKSSHSTEQSAELPKTTSISVGATLAAGDPIFTVPSISVVPSIFVAFSVPAETPIAAVSDDDEPAKPDFLPLVYDIRTLEVIPTEFGLGEIQVITRADGSVKRFSTLRELMHWVGRADLMVLYGMVSDKYKLERATGLGLGLWSDLRTLITAREDRDASIIWDDQDQWEIRS